MKRTQARRWLLAAALLLAMAVTARAWQPTGWTYWDWPWAYESTSGDWHWFAAGGTQWMYAFPPGAGWALLQESELAQGWSYWNGDWAYDGDTGAWCWRNTGDVQSCVNMRTTQWSVLGQAGAGGLYMVIDLSGGPSASSYPVTYLTAVPAGGWTDVYKTTKLAMRRIPAGMFTMGSPSGELGRDSDETQHLVTLTKDFYIGVFEVTQRQWELVMGNKPSYFNNATYYQTRPVEQVSYYYIRENPANSAISPNWPASSQVHADSFMGKLRSKTGIPTFDLPTESQWEYACRAGTTTALNSGYNLTSTSSDPRMDAVGRYWYNGGSGYTQNGDTSVATAKVGSYLPNAWGLYDMHGNVWEWCLDWYGTYPGSAQDPLGAASGSDRVGRGGGWYSFARYCRSADRGSLDPGSRFDDGGFRLSRTLP